MSMILVLLLALLKITSFLKEHFFLNLMYIQLFFGKLLEEEYNMQSKYRKFLVKYSFLWSKVPDRINRD